MRRTRLVSLALSLATALGVSLTLSAPAQAAPADRYVALGDSYASGVGAGSYTSESGSCQRSTNAYPALYAANIKPASYRSVACSGATTTSLINTQLSALSSTTTLVSVTIGGNDVGFGNIMSTCVLQGTTQCVAAVQAAQDKARAQLPGLLRNVYNGIKTRAPSARVVVVGYPVFYQLGTTCIGLSATSRAKINEGINLVDDLTRTAAVAAGFKFADVRSQFVGHQLCSSGTKWLHALNFANLGISYHPTAAGQSGGYYPVFRSVAG
ncbi:SGNH/GDSL hydrolase family protein [Micromonospora sp. DT46]|uniref:SGNH/GDSL hydrolase family protein n=1 Tax=unclassified Micromonospora TaxID=2617518 RepID=UPI00124B62BA|nr:MULTISPECIES: SGNH/GDSL hydrolase family protein [unclassified Micromonospora]KAB1153721.1 SGNH/GDSL hydrolase family protein [Micromonospora sp. AMSO12t]WSG01154.1 SGNH/GDSL hydrolase family protein [Micromonospora sp. NBC_01740]